MTLVAAVLFVTALLLLYFCKCKKVDCSIRRRITTRATTTEPDIPEIENYAKEAQEPPLPFSSDTPSLLNTGTPVASVSESSEKPILSTNAPPGYSVSATYTAYPAQGTGSLQETDKTVDFTAHQY